jgi:hypothetical protein
MALERRTEVEYTKVLTGNARYSVGTLIDVQEVPFGNE